MCLHGAWIGNGSGAQKCIETILHYVLKSKGKNVIQ